MTLSLTLPIPPHSKGRPRVAFNRGRARTYTPPETEAWERLAEWHIRSALGHRWTAIDAPVRIEVTAVDARPATRPRGVSAAAWKSGARVYRVGRRDADNEVKATMDALSNAGLWTDDNLAVDVRAVKQWAAAGESPCVEVIVTIIA